jgi:acyl carrier protein
MTSILSELAKQKANPVLTMSSNRLYQTIAGVLDVTPDSLTEESSPATIPDWDSLNHLNLVMALESEFSVSLSVDDTLEMADVAAIRGILNKYGVEL